MSWPTDSLDSIAILDRQSVHPSEADAATPYLGLEHLDGDGGIDCVETVDSTALKSNKFRFTDRHILFGKLRPYLRKIVRPEFSGICSTDIIPILPKEGLSRDYLFYFLRTPATVELATSRCSGANLPRLSPKQLASFQIPFPPLAEQKRIARILDAADALRAKRRESLAQLDTLLQSTFLDMFGDPVTNPKEWEVRQVDEICRLVRGSSPRPKGDPQFYGGPVPRLMVSDITRDGFWVTPGIDSLTETGASKSRPVPAGTVVMAVSGDVGVVATVQVPCCVHDGFVAFLDLDETAFDSRFFMFQFHFLKVTHGRRKAGAIFQNLTTKDIKAMRLPTPRLELQRRFAEHVDAVEKLRGCVNTHLAELDTLFASLQSRAFRGNP